MAESSNATPIPLIVISWVLLLFGIVYFISSGLLFLIGINTRLADNPILLIFQILNLTASIFYITTSFGLRKMKRWSLYLYTISACIGLLNIRNVIQSIESKGIQFSDVFIFGLPLLILAYLWSIQRKFV